LAPRPGDADDLAVEAGAAHVDADQPALGEDLRAHDAAARGDVEGLAADAPLVVQMAGEDSQAIAAFFGLAAVWVDDAQLELGAARRGRAEQDAVAADAVV